MIKLVRASFNSSGLLVLAASLLLTGCAGGMLGKSRIETASEIAATGGLNAGELQAGQFRLAIWSRVEHLGAPVHLYIEGDGLAWRSKKQPAMDPTPRNPVGLRLAAKDPAANVIYLARPCHYISPDRAGPCENSYWTHKRFAPEILHGYMRALDDLKQQWHVTEFHLIGYSGGANIAALLAAQRIDVSSLRTVAGNLDHDALNRLHGVTLMPHSLNARDQANRLANLRQNHFVGMHDEIVTVDIYRSYKRAMGASICSQAFPVTGANHNRGWEEMWPVLLKKDFSC